MQNEDSPTLFVAAALGLLLGAFLWHNYHQMRDVERLLVQEALVVEIYESAGYGGGIHRFKNYVLRRDPADAERAAQAFANALTNLETLRDTTILAPLDAAAVDAFATTVQAYLDNIDVVAAMAPHMPAEAVDATVRIDDTGAIGGLQTLKLQLRQRAQDLTRALQRRVMILALTAFTLIGGLLMIVSRKQRQLGQSAQRLRTRNEELQHFAYRASHDLKGPLSSMTGLARTIDEDLTQGDLAEAKANVSKIVELCERQRRLLTNVLELTRAKLERGTRSTIDIEEMIGDLWDGLHWMWQDKEVSLTCDFQVTGVTAETFRLSQTLENLLSNAIKYSADDGARVHIHTRRHGDRVTINVCDNGEGIAPQHRVGVFGMFTRYAHSPFGGSGLGLPIAKRHADAMDARLTFACTDRGTTFSLELPDPE